MPSQTQRACALLCPPLLASIRDQRADDFINAISVIFELLFFFFQAEDGIRDLIVTGVQTCALPILTFPEPVIAVAIEPKTKADQEKMGVALAKLMQEDPTFKVHTDVETNQVIIRGKIGRASCRERV